MIKAVRSQLRQVVVLVLSIVATVALSISAASAAPVPMGQAVLHGTSIGVEPRAPFGRCSIIHWERKSTTTIRIYAFSDDLKKYFPVDDPYGLLWITIHDTNGNLTYSESHNVSRWQQFDQTFPARKGYRVSVSLTNDINTVTLCTGGATV